jgi:hypothetical protein
MIRCQPQQISARVPNLGLVPWEPWPSYRAVLLAILAWAMLLPATAGETETAAGGGGDVPDVELGPFQRFLADPPWIKYVRFRRSGNQEPEMDYPEYGKSFVVPSPWAHYDGALQPKGFFLRHLAYTSRYYRAKWSDNRLSDELVYEPPRPGEEWIIGASTGYWWQLDDREGVLVIAPREPEPGHSVTNGVEIIAKYQKQILEVLQCLGMPELVDAEVEWLDATRFQATSWQHGKIEGAISRRRADLVEELEYQVTRPAKRRVVMRYAYSPQMRMPPVEMVRTVVADSGTRSFTNILDRWEEGLDPQHPQGFTVRDFRRKTEPLQFFLVWSNGVRYKMNQEGTLTRTTETPPDFSALARPSRFRAISGVASVTGGLVLLGVLVGIWRARNKNSQKQKN